MKNRKMRKSIHSIGCMFYRLVLLHVIFKHLRRVVKKNSDSNIDVAILYEILNLSSVGIKVHVH